jgi:hypothetical protein
MKLADQVWIATALLHQQYPERDAFSVAEIVERAAEERFVEPQPSGVYTHAQAHCVANRPPQPAKLRMLYATPEGGRRLCRRGDDYHPQREDGKTLPDPDDIPARYHFLFSWYVETYRSGSSLAPLRRSSPDEQRKPAPARPTEEPAPASEGDGKPAGTSSTRRIALVGCVKSKLSHPAPARKLYTSDLFRKASAWAEQNADAWYILSAKYGLVHPDATIAPYELTLTTFGKAEKVAWAEKVREQMAAARLLQDGTVFVWLAGASYQKELCLRLSAFAYERPLGGLGIGQQLSWLKQALEVG